MEIALVTVTQNITTVPSLVCCSQYAAEVLPPDSCGAAADRFRKRS